ncbi:MAG: glycosyltransferase family 4 protein [Alphaproteobacteria bacterium]|nr:glycosyltransferase family 4 protein [Alphaproteobacteria bacterium]
MARIAIADDGIAFDGRHAETAPLGGAESAVVGLAEALARRGHEVTVYNKCREPLDHAGVHWRRLAEGTPDRADLYIANRGDKLLKLLPKAQRTIFWIHNPASYLLKWRYLSKLALRRPLIVFSGASHASTYPRWAPSGGRVIIPYGIAEIFRTTLPAEAPPPPRAIFTSNPLRSLDWLLDRWERQIRPKVPGAELHIFSGARTYGAVGSRKAAEMLPVLERARSLAGAGIVLREPVARGELAAAMRQMRVYLYRGDPGETFCASAGEAQAMGIPGVVQDIGSLRERIEDGVTGFVAADEEAFAGAAIRLLTEDGLWQRQHDAALATKRSFGWDEAAIEFEALLI